MSDLTEYFFKVADSMPVGDYIKEDTIDFEEALLIPEYFTESLDYSMYIQSSIEDVITFEPDDKLGLQDNEVEPFIVSILIEITKVITGTRPISLFYHKPVVHYLARVSKVLNVPESERKKAFQKLLCNDQNVACCLMLRTISALAYYFELFQEHCQHGDDVNFYAFTVGRWVQDYLEKLHGFDVNYEEAVSKFLPDIAAKNKNPLVRLVLFVCRFIENVQFIAAVDSKVLVQVTDLLTNEQWNYCQGRSTDLEFKKYLDDYKSKFFDPKNAVAMCALSDQQLTKIEDEAPFSEVFVYIQSWKQKLAVFIGQLQSIANDPPFSLMIGCVFARELNSGFYEFQKTHLSMFASQEFCAIKQLKQRRYSVQLDQTVFETPQPMRLLMLNFYGRQTEFFARQISVQVQYYLKSSLATLINKVKDKDENIINKDCDQIGEWLANGIVGLVATGTGRCYVKLQQLLKDGAKLEFQHQYSQLMQRFLLLDHVGVLYLLSGLDICLQEEAWQVYYFAIILQIEAIKTLVLCLCGDEEKLSRLSDCKYQPTWHLVTTCLLKLRHFWREFKNYEVNFDQLSAQEKLTIYAKFRFLRLLNIDLSFRSLNEVVEHWLSLMSQNNIKLLNNAFNKAAQEPGLALYWSKLNRLKLHQILKVFMSE